MLIDKNHPLANKVVVKDVMNNPITLLLTFDTETEIATMSLVGFQDVKGPRKLVVVKGESGENKLAVATVHLPGCKLYYRETNKEVPKEDLYVESQVPSSVSAPSDSGNV